MSDPRADLLARIESVLDRDVRAGVLADGGAIEVVGIDDDRIVQVRLLGACQSCPSAAVTLTMGIEAALKAEIPEVRFVEAVPEEKINRQDAEGAKIGNSCPILAASASWRFNFFMSPRAAYVHVPFCAHKCGYCDFASLAGADHLADRYLAALESEMARMGTRAEVDTIFIGGGTPTRLDADQLRRLLTMVRHWFPLAPGGEWTVEANPGTLDAAKADVLAEGGVNRVSLGAQSFRPESLRVLERIHAPEDVPRALDLVRPRFPRWSIDLIFGVPGSSPSMWEEDLERALALGPDHLSCYGLVYEKGTALWKQWDAGLVQSLDEETERAMYAHTIDRLAAAGLDQYEISNFARPGHESRHNLVYWANEPYFGVGLGAARFIDGVRSVNTRDLPAYLRRVEAGDDPTGPSESLAPEPHARETAVLMLRRTGLGLDRADFLRRTGFSLDALAGPAVSRAVSNGLLDDDGRRLRFTREGLFLADSVLCDLL